MSDVLVVLPSLLFLLAIAAVPLYFTAILPLRVGLRRGLVSSLERAYLICVPLSVVATICLFAAGQRQMRGVTGDMSRWSLWTGQPPPPGIWLMFLPAIACVAAGLLVAIYGRVRRAPTTEKAGAIGAASGLIQLVIVAVLVGGAEAP